MVIFKTAPSFPEIVPRNIIVHELSFKVGCVNCDVILFPNMMSSLLMVYELGYVNVIEDITIPSTGSTLLRFILQTTSSVP